MGIFRPQKYIFMSIKLFTIFSIKCYEESHKINEWKFSCDTTKLQVWIKSKNSTIAWQLITFCDKRDLISYTH